MHVTSYKALGKAILVLASILLVGVMGSCENPSGTKYPNSLPKTRLANIPVNDTMAVYIFLGAIPEQTLYWAGDDPDGFIVGYRFRWIDFHRTGYDTVHWRTIVNLTTLSGQPLDTLIEVHENAASVSRIYNFLATIDPSSQTVIKAIGDSLATGRWFSVPYASGHVPGDSIKGIDPIQFEAPTKGIFIFDSPADSNQHRFEVKAIDNDDAEDPTPPFVHFWTLRSPSPSISALNGPFINNVPVLTGAVAYILSYPSDLAPGLKFTFAAIDPSTDQRDFSWTVDDTSSGWSPWSAADTAIVTALNLRETGSDTHTVYVRAKNRWGALSQIASRRFRALVPPIDNPLTPRRTLLINNCRVNTASIGPGLDSTAVNSFYRSVLDSLGKRDSVDVWTSASRAGVVTSFPPLSLLLQYTNVLLVADNRYPPIGAGSNLRITLEKQTILKDYLFLGGKLIYSGSPDISNVIVPYTQWANEIFHIQTSIPFRQSTTLEFVGSSGMLGYPNILLDSTKVTADSGYALRFIAVNYPRGFGQTISTFISKDLGTGFSGAPLGIRYLAPPPVPPVRTTYSVVHFGMPLYFARRQDVINALKFAYSDIRESSLP